MTSPLFLKKYKDSRTAALGGMLSKSYPSFHNEPVLRITVITRFSVGLGPKNDTRSFFKCCKIIYKGIVSSTANILNINSNYRVILWLPPFRESFVSNKYTIFINKLSMPNQRYKMSKFDKKLFKILFNLPYGEYRLEFCFNTNVNIFGSRDHLKEYDFYCVLGKRILILKDRECRYFNFHIN